MARATNGARDNGRPGFSHLCRRQDVDSRDSESQRGQSQQHQRRAAWEFNYPET